ncbi:hypothetical protein K469DRAFT_567143 [Zopfia rhizophila CBS 207.26]|uniref:F-box domain-containing protein n=1 Tax=Zopfia rhizophila CBS 207.26 TaxID=1314779 RepID=A0A6A6E8K1_9PEZI|nr:hypothetical protein K469DRAFT_567143 [Zopfia rhizophila CBS 207.26]
MEQLPSSLTNATSFLPSSADLLMVVPRLLQRAGSFAEHMDSIFGKIRSGGSIIAEPTSSNITNATVATNSGTFVQESAAAASSAALGNQDVSGSVSALQALKNVGSFFSYMTSKWAIATFTTAILLNRTHFYASSRVPLSFNRWHLRLMLYILPTIVFLYRIQWVLQAIRCQTSPDWSEMQYGGPGKVLDTDFAGEGGLLWRTSSALLFWQDTEASCQTANMLPPNPSSPRPAGSLSLLWPLFLSLGFSQFIETFSCALQGRQSLPETGMTIFEHSLAFAEAEAVVTKPLSLDSARFWKPVTISTPDGTLLTLSRTSISQFANVPPEVLLISLISSLSHLSSNFLAIVGLRARFRLVTTGIWGLAYMSAFVWSFIRFATIIAEPGHQVGILRFPTVCIVGFIPHLLILIGIAACAAIYALAFGLTLLSPPPSQRETMSWKERFEVAYRNLHANIHLSTITPVRINWQEDFYTAILKVGFTVLTAASEAVYLNEGTRINVNSMTWLEKKRLQEIIARRRMLRQSLATIPTELRGDSMADGIEVADGIGFDRSAQYSASGYARERRARGITTTSEASRAVGRDNGVGLQQRRGRWTLTYLYLRGISRLLMAIQAKLIISGMRRIRITYSPRWLSRLAGPQINDKTRTPAPGRMSAQVKEPSEPWLVVDEQTRLRPRSDTDIEEFVRRKLREWGYYDVQGHQETEEHLTEYLYNWWKIGGRWGDTDTSGDYALPLEDDDTTSVISMATTTAEGEWSDVDDGQITPTRDSPFPCSSGSTPLPDNLIDLSRLSHLLDPKTQEEQDEARLLSRHLQNPGILTRSQYRKAMERDQARILTSSRYRMDGFAGSAQLTPEEEERLLEQFILDRRSPTINAQGISAAGTWDTGAEGMGSEGPQCLSQTRFFSSLSQLFMQPEPSNVFRSVSPQLPAPENTTSSSQHGIRYDDHPASLLPHDEERREARPDVLGHDTASSAPLSERVTDTTNETARLSPTSPSPRNRIEEYENALAQSEKKRSDGPIFEVIKKNRKPDDKSSPISKLPNEILTHAISHLSPNDLSAVSLVSRRFNDLVTTPHAWRVAFARYFPGPEALVDSFIRFTVKDTGETVRSERRSFTRLTALASWKSEYILRTRLLRSLTRGKPVQVPSSAATARSGQTQPTSPVVMYNAQTFTTINHLHATFATGLNKHLPRFIHGADDIGMVTSSDPSTGKVDPWGQSDPNFYGQFSERFPGVAEWGLGPGEVVGCPNVMDVSQPHGMIYGQGCPEGSCYFRSLDEMRGRFIAEPADFSMPEFGIPKLGIDGGAICCVWIAKTSTIPSLSEGLVGILMGSAAGIVTACSLGTDGLRGHRFQRGELTARWVLSPGVPIVALAVDENYSLKRHAQNRIWAVALNALGELFYLTKFPTRSSAPKDIADDHTEYLAWLTGRSVYWNLVEPSRRTARPDPYKDGETDGSYSPRSSWDGMCLSKEQIVAETKEIQHFLRKQPKDFRKSCLGWDMRRRLEVDFAGDDGNYAGEAMVVFECGIGEDDIAIVKRFTRWKVHEKEKGGLVSTPSVAGQASLFGGPVTPDPSHQGPSQRTRSSSYTSSTSSPERVSLVEEWRCSTFTFGGLKSVELTTTTLDHSTFATLTISEDPALGFSTGSNASSPYASPMSVASQPASLSDIPGQRARIMAAGTKAGIVLVWDIRAPVSRSSEFTNTVEPIRIIYTESPEISSLALTALHLIHGGNDGLVQAWDPLASSTQPVRTLNSRFSSRARRRLVQAQASAQGVGINLFAAGAICLDPDPTVLRGAVSLGTQIRYWSYSSSAADQYKSSKRRLRRSERGSNNGGERFSGTSRANLKDYIANEKYELEREKRERRRHAERLAGRFGVDLLGSEEEALAYAAMLSQESLEMDEQRRKESESSSMLSSDTVTPEPSVHGQSVSPNIDNDQELDVDIAEAIRLSLQDSPASGIYGSGSPALSCSFDIPIKYAKGCKSPPRSKTSPGLKSVAGAGSSKQGELTDLEFALQLSLAEEQSRKEAEEEGFPALSPSPGAGGKGKGKGRML